MSMCITQFRKKVTPLCAHVSNVGQWDAFSSPA